MKKLLLSITMGLLMASQTINAQVPNYVPTDGLVGWWDFKGNVNDLSINANNGTDNGATLTTDRFGNQNGAYEFTQYSDSNIDIPLTRGMNAINNEAVSIMIWVKPTTIVSVKPENNTCVGGVSVNLAYSGQNWAIRPNQVFPLGTNFGIGGLSIGTNGLMTAKHATNILDVIQNYDNPLNGFVCVVQTYQNNEAKLYVDGILVNTKISNCPNINYFPQIISLGGSLYSSNFSGIIDDVAIFNRALTQDEITNLFNASIPTVPTLSFCDIVASVYPNPTTDFLNINTDKEVHIKIRNSYGKLVMNKKVIKQISLAELDKGMYFVEIWDKNIKCDTKIIRE